MKGKEKREEEFQEPEQLEIDYDQIVARLENDFIASLPIQNNMNSPLFNPADIVQIRHSDFYNEKDMVFYQFENHFFIRRLIKMTENKFYVCGDTEFEVRIISPKDILGRVISRERGTKRYSLLLNKDKLYTRAMARKAKLLMKKHSLYDDETSISDVYKIASMSKQDVKEETISIIYPETPKEPSSRLEKELAGFLSPEERLNQYLNRNASSTEEDAEIE